MSAAPHATTDGPGHHVQTKHKSSTQIVTIPIAPELCPPHWRLPARRQSLRKKLKSLVADTFSRTHPIVRHLPRRPIMRMKDSDDYLTARAANPRTGQISPSVSSSPKTPDTPGAALRAHALNLIRGSPSPTKRLGGIRLANEGKKLKEGATATWLAGGTFRGTDSSDLVLPSMIQQPVARKIFCSTESTFRDDEFVVKMPSAREPQPYNFPGSNGNEIQAFEHYKRKTKRTSGDGYDRRLLVDARKVSDGSVAPGAHTSPVKPEYHSPAVPQHESTPHPAVAPLNVIKRRQVATETTTINRAQPVTFTAYSTPHAQQRGFEPLPAPRAAPTAYRNFSPESLSTVLSSSLEEDLLAHETRQDRIPSEGNVPTSPGVSHLNQLPRVRLVHPSLAATPSSPAKEVRACSLGCSRNVSNNTCVESRKTSLQSESGKLSLFDNDDGKPARLTHEGKIALELMELGMLALTICWQTFRDFVLAHTSALGRLFPQDLTTWEKLMILKSLFCLLVKITAVSIVIALIWKVTGIALQMLRLVFWPIEIVVRTARWAAPAA